MKRIMCVSIQARDPANFVKTTDRLQFQKYTNLKLNFKVYFSN